MVTNNKFWLFLFLIKQTGKITSISSIKFTKCKCVLCKFIDFSFMSIKPLMYSNATWEYFKLYFYRQSKPYCFSVQYTMSQVL